MPGFISDRPLARESDPHRRRGDRHVRTTPSSAPISGRTTFSTDRAPAWASMN